MVETSELINYKKLPTLQVGTHLVSQCIEEEKEEEEEDWLHHHE